MKVIEILPGKKKRFRNSNGDVYWHIVGGFAWPSGSKPGFVVVVAEEAERDYSLPGNPRHMKLLAEFQSQNLDELFRKCFELSRDYHAPDFYGDWTSPQMALWDKANDERKDDSGSLSLQPAPRVEHAQALEFYAQIIKKLTQTQKTLHLGEGSLLPGYLLELPQEELSHKRAGDYPAVAALGYAVAVLELHKPVETKHKEGAHRRYYGPLSWMA